MNLLPSCLHRYYFHVLALSRYLDPGAGESKKTLLQEMEKHMLTKGSLMGGCQQTERK